MSSVKHAGQRKAKAIDLHSPKLRPRLRNLMHLDQLIRAGQAPNCATLARELEVSRRTILRDVEFFRLFLGAPIHYDRLRRGYVYTEPSWAMPSVKISEGELLALLVGEQAVRAYAGTPWAERLRRVFDRLADELPEQVQLVLREVPERICFGTDLIQLDPVILETVERAVRQNQTLRMGYAPLGATKEKEYLIDPYVLRRANGTWYMAGKVHGSDHVPLFNLSRVCRVAPTGDGFDYDESGFDPKQYFLSTFNVFHGTQPQRVVIDFSGTAAELVRERTWRSSQKLTPRPNGGVRLEMTVSHLYDVYGWVLSWGGQARVISPPELISIVTGEARRILERHDKIAQ